MAYACTEEEFIAECTRTTHYDGSPTTPRPLTITVMAEDGFTVLYETTPVAIARDYSDVPEELHVYDEDLADMKQLATAINGNSGSYFVLSKETETGSIATTYVTPSFTVARRKNIHLLRGHISAVHQIIDET